MNFVNLTLDTNVLVRLCTQDDAAQAAAAEYAVKSASLIALPTPVLCELVWVLLRGYRYSGPQVVAALRLLVNTRQVVCDMPAVLAGLAMLEQGGDFADAVIAFEGSAMGGTEFVSFDQQAVKLLRQYKRKARLLAT